MVKAPATSNGYGGSKSGNNAKFKSWRRGKSSKAKTAGSLKQQLRGLQRLQTKKAADGASADNETSAKELQQKMVSLQQQIDSRDASEKERLNSQKCHKMRFIERQRTTRLYKQWTTQLQEATDQKQVERQVSIRHELWKLALDQVYIAHFPLDQTSYLSIFQNGSNVRRPILNDRLLYKMASSRRRVLERLAESSVAVSEHDNEDGPKRQLRRVDWIHPSQYERIQNVTTWSTDQEREAFGNTEVTSKTVESRVAKQNGKAKRDTAPSVATDALKPKADSRFQGLGTSETQTLLLQQHDEFEKELDEEFAEGEARAGSNDAAMDDSDIDEVNSDSDANDDKDSDNDSDEDDSDEEDDNDDEDTGGNDHGIATDRKKSQGKDDTTLALRTLAARKGNHPVESNEVDDFLVEATDEAAVNVFAHAKSHVPAKNEAAGDKSQGWATQRQYPGQFRKKQTRR